MRALRRAGPHLRPVVLSADPERTARLHGVAAAPRDPRGVWRTLADADLLVSGGGSLLQDVTSARSVLYYLSVMAMAHLRGIPVAWVAHGVGPVRRRWLRALVGREARRAVHLSVRDEGSRRALAAWSGLDPSRIVTLPDPAWALAEEAAGAGSPALHTAGSRPEAGPDAPAERQRPAWRVAVAWRDWPGQPVPAERVGRALGEGMAAALGGTVRVSLLAMQPRQDLGACERLARSLQEALRDLGCDASVGVQEAPADPVEAIRALGAFDVVVGVRLHALILAGVAGVPFVALAYDPKVTALLAETGWPVAAVEPRDAADAGTWRHRLEAVAADHARLRRHLESTRHDLARRVLEGLAPVAHLGRVELEPLPRADSPPPPVEVLGVGVHPVSLSEGEAIAAAWLTGERDDRAPVRQVVTLNPEIVMRARSDPTLAGIVRQADLVVPDGIGVVWAGRMLGYPMKGRVPGIELAERLLAFCAASGLPVFLVGGRPEGPEGPSVAEEAARRLRMRPEMTGLVVAGAHHGYFAPGSAEEAALLETLERTRPALLLVGMGSPRQEAFIARHRERLRGRVRVAVGVGGSLDVWAGRARRAPPLVRRLALEWLYRTALDVRRLRRLAALPAFVAAVLAEKMGGIMGQRGHRRV